MPGLESDAVLVELHLERTGQPLLAGEEGQCCMKYDLNI